MSLAWISQTVAQGLAEQLANCLVLGIAIAFVAWIWLRFGGRTGSVTRFAVWFSALLAIATLPVAGFVGRHFSSAQVASHTGVTLPHSWALYLFAAWATIALLGVLKVVAGLLRLIQFRRSCTALDRESIHPALLQTMESCNSKRPVVLCTSDSVNVPAAIGFFKPAIVFPTWAMEELSEAELNSILFHELAHLTRWDDWTNLTQKILRAVFFFHPAVWWIDSRLSLEREMACDDIVLARTANPRAYAECLVSLTEKGLLHRGIQFVQAAIGRARQTTLRVTQILDSQRPAATTVRKPVFTVLAVAAMAVSVASPLTPRLVSFENQAPVVSSASIPSNYGSLQQAAFHAASLRKSAASAAPRITNAMFHPDVASPLQSARNTSEPANPVARKSAITGATAVAAKLPVNRARFEPREIQEEVVLVVMQQRVYDARGESMLTYSIYRFVSFTPRAAPVSNPKKI